MIISTSLASSFAQALLADITAGSTSNPKIEIYSGVQPASVFAPIVDTLLAELDLSATAGTESNGVITFDPIADDPSGNASGEAGWGRILDRDGNSVAIFSVSNTNGSGELKLSSVIFAESLPVSITSASIQIGN